MISLIRVEHQNLNCIWDNPEYLYKFDRPYFISVVATDIYETIKKLYENEIKISIDEVITCGNARNPEITKENLTFLRSQEYDLGNFDFYFTNLKKNYAKIKIEEKILKDIVIATSSKGELNVEKMRELDESLQEHLEIIEGKESNLRSIQQIGSNYRGVLVARKQGKYNFSTGDSILDSHLAMGFAPGQITTIFGASGVGKSAFVLNLFSKQINKRIPTMMISLEMDEIATMDRVISNRKRIPARELQFNKADEMEDSQEVFDVFEDGLAELSSYGNRFFLVDDPSVRIDDLPLLIKAAQKKMKTKYLVCIVDLLTMISDFGSQPSEMELSMNKLNGQAKTLGIHYIFVVQANRSVDSAQVSSIEDLDKLRPKNLSGIKNSAAIAERSRLVLSVFRKKYYAKELFADDPQLDLMDDVMTVTILKQNQGVSGTQIHYLYDPSIFRIYPYIEENPII